MKKVSTGVLLASLAFAGPVVSADRAEAVTWKTKTVGFHTKDRCETHRKSVASSWVKPGQCFQRPNFRWTLEISYRTSWFFVGSGDLAAPGATVAGG